MAGTGNLILKRGNVEPSDTQNGGSLTLLKGMPAAQIVGLSRTSNLNGDDLGDYAFDNYPNRLWIGMSGYGNLQNSIGGTGDVFGPGPSYNIPNGAEKRPLWVGAEIRGNSSVYRSGTTVPLILKADWANAVDTVLVTQKAIKTYVDTQVSSKGTMSSFGIQANGVSPTQRIDDGDTISFMNGNGFEFVVSATDTITGIVNFSSLVQDVSCTKSGAVTVNKVKINEITSGTYYPVFANASGSSKDLFIDEIGESIGGSSITPITYAYNTGLLSVHQLKIATDIRWQSSPVLTKHQLQLYGTTAGWVIIKTNSTAGNITLTLPNSLPVGTGASGLLQTDSSGNLSWVSGVPSSSANNLNGGATGYIPYQSATNTTTFLTIGAENSILTVNTGVPAWTSTPKINSIDGTATSSNISLYSNIQSGSISIGSGLSSGTISIASGTGQKTINIGTGGDVSTTIQIGTVSSSGTSSVFIGSTAGTSNVYIQNNKLTLGSNASNDRIVLVGDTTSSAGTRTHTFPNKPSGNVVIVNSGSSEVSGYALISTGPNTLPSWGPIVASAPDSVKYYPESDQNTRYPIPFISNTNINDAPAPNVNLADGSQQTGYLRTDWTSTTVGMFYNPGGVYTSSGNFPQPASAGGTLYAAFFSGVIDGGTWS